MDKIVYAPTSHNRIVNASPLSAWLGGSARLCHGYTIPTPHSTTFFCTRKNASHFSLSGAKKRRIQSTALLTLTHQYALLPIILYYIRIYVKSFTHLSSPLPTVTHYSLNNMLSFLLSYLSVAPNKTTKSYLFSLTDLIKNTLKCSLYKPVELSFIPMPYLFTIKAFKAQ